VTDGPPRRRPVGRLWRLAPLLLAIAGSGVVNYLYGTHPVELIIALPKSVDDGRSGLDMRITRPNGKLVLHVEENTRPPEGHTIVVQAKLPRGKFLVDAMLQGKSAHLGAELAYDGEDSVEVQLQPK